METTFIYALTEPGTRIIRYFGKSGNPKKRLVAHIREARKGKIGHVAYWIRKILKRDQKPDVHVLCEVPDNDWERFERAFVALGRQCGLALTNDTDGGDCGPVLKGKKNPMFGGGAKHPNFGKKLSLETRLKMSAAQSGEKHSLYGKRGEKSPNFGKKHSPEAIAKMSATHKNFWALKQKKDILWP